MQKWMFTASDFLEKFTSSYILQDSGLMVLIHCLHAHTFIRNAIASRTIHNAVNMRHVPTSIPFVFLVPRSIVKKTGAIPFFYYIVWCVNNAFGSELFVCFFSPSFHNTLPILQMSRNDNNTFHTHYASQMSCCSRSVYIFFLSFCFCAIRFRAFWAHVRARKSCYSKTCP